MDELELGLEQFVIFGAMSPLVRQAVLEASDEIGVRVESSQMRMRVAVRDTEQAYLLGLGVGRRLHRRSCEDDPVKTYTIREAAEQLGLSRQRVHVLIREHRIPVVRTPLRLLLSAGSLAALQALPRRPGRPWPKKASKTEPK